MGVSVVGLQLSSSCSRLQLPVTLGPSSDNPRAAPWPLPGSSERLLPQFQNTRHQQATEKWYFSRICESSSSGASNQGNPDFMWCCFKDEPLNHFLSFTNQINDIKLGNRGDIGTAKNCVVVEVAFILLYFSSSVCWCVGYVFMRATSSPKQYQPTLELFKLVNWYFWEQHELIPKTFWLTTCSNCPG